MVVVVVVVVVVVSLAFIVKTKLWKSSERQMSANSMADSTMPRGVSP